MLDVPDPEILLPAPSVRLFLDSSNPWYGNLRSWNMCLLQGNGRVVTRINEFPKASIVAALL